MNNNTEVKNDSMEIDLYQLMSAVWHKLWVVILAAVVVAAGSLLYTKFFVTPIYRSSALVYVNNNSVSIGDTALSLKGSDITASRTLVDTYIVILKTRTTLNEVIQRADLPYSYETLSGMISAEAVNETEVFEISVKSTDPEEAKLIANTIAAVLPEKISSVVDGSSMRIVDYAVKPASQYSPSVSKNTVLGGIIGAVIAIAAIVMNIMFDTLVRSEQQLTQTFDIPVLAVIPDMTQPSGGRYGKGYGGRYGKSYGYYQHRGEQK